MARLKTEFWVQAFLRRCEIQGHYGAVVYKGAPEAGALYVIINHLNGTYDLLAPAPGAAYGDDGERRFVREFAAARSWSDVSERIGRRRKSDPDIWAVEVEDRNGLAGLVPESN